MRLEEARAVVEVALYEAARPQSYKVSHWSRPFRSQYKGKGAWSGMWISQGTEVFMLDFDDGTKGAELNRLRGFVIDGKPIRLKPIKRGVKQSDGSWRDVEMPAEITADEVRALMQSHEGEPFFFYPKKALEGYGDPRENHRATKQVKWDGGVWKVKAMYGWDTVSEKQLNSRVLRHAFCMLGTEYGKKTALLPYPYGSSI